MRIVISRHPGVCYGVRRASRLVSAKLRKGDQTVACVGPLFGSAQEMQRLESEGLKVVDRVEDLAGDEQVAFPVYGASAEVMDAISARKIGRLNTTCPRASMAQTLAYRLAKEGYVVLTVGSEDSREAEVLMSFVRKGWEEKLEGLGSRTRTVFVGSVVEGASGEKAVLARVPQEISHVAVLVQPNGTLDGYQATVAAAAGRFEEVRAYNTICRSVVVRVQEASRLAQQCDAMVIVGDPGLETEAMKRACLDRCRRVAVARRPGQIDSAWAEQIEVVGVCVATATPDWVLVQVVEELRRHGGAELEKGPAMA